MKNILSTLFKLFNKIFICESQMDSNVNISIPNELHFTLKMMY